MTTTDQAVGARRQPVLYLSHGAPPLADDTTWTAELAQWSSDLPRPSSVLMVSAHWELAPIAVSATSGDVPLLYDFWGFPQRFYEVTYDAPGAPELARSVAGLMSGAGETLHQDPSRGLDHGAYVPLKEMYPGADIPVLQLSMPTLDPQRLFALGQRLAPLRDEGVLIVGSGFTTHNLGWFNPRAGSDAPPRRRRPSSMPGRRRRWAPVTSMPCSTSSTRRRRLARRTLAPSTGRRSTSPWVPSRRPAAWTPTASSTGSGSGSASGPGSSPDPRPPP